METIPEPRRRMVARRGGRNGRLRTAILHGQPVRGNRIQADRRMGRNGSERIDPLAETGRRNPRHHLEVRELAKEDKAMGDAGSKAAEHDADIGGPAGSENISAPVFSGDQSERPMPGPFLDARAIVPPDGAWAPVRRAPSCPCRTGGGSPRPAGPCVRGCGGGSVRRGSRRPRSGRASRPCPPGRSRSE